MNWLVITLALLSALSYAGMSVVMRQAMATAASSTALWITLCINVVLLWSVSLLFYGWQMEQLWDWRYFILSGIFAPLLGRLFQFKGMVQLGANITTPITLTHPVVTILLAIVFLGETLTAIGLVGAALVVICSIIIGAASERQTSDQSIVNPVRMSLAWPLLASLCYGIATVLRKQGMDTGSDPVTAAAVTITTSWIVSTLYMLFTGSFRSIRCNRREMSFYLLAGFFSAIGPVLIYAALSYGDLVTVAPIASTAPLMVLVLSYLFTRNQELFTGKVVFGTGGTVLGLVLLSTYGIA